MSDASKANSQSPSSSSTAKPHPAGGRQRVISSCLTCRRRKVRCDHVHPICGACTRGNHLCTWNTDQGLGGQAGAGRITKPSYSANGKPSRGNDVQSRLERLELLLEKAVSGKGAAAQNLDQAKHDHERLERRDTENHFSPSSNSQSSQGAGISCDNNDGTLLLDEGKSQFVSSLHYALLAEEVNVLPSFTAYNIEVHSMYSMGRGL